MQFDCLNFTLAHSITLAVANFGWLGLPSEPVEATIALSILFLAGDLIKVKRGQAWKSNDDGSTTIHFGCEGKANNITSGGHEFNYIVAVTARARRSSDEAINPVNAVAVK